MQATKRPVRVLAPFTLAVLTLALAGPVSAAGAPASTAAPASRATVAGPLTPPAAALHANGMPSGNIHGLNALGYLPSAAASADAPAPSVAGPASLPGSVDLSQYNPPVGNQNPLNSCVSWAVGYYLRGWYAKRDGYYPAGGPDGNGSYAPMYLYSQLVHGQNVGTYIHDNFNIMQQQGIDTRADYTQGDYDNVDLPTSAETANALHIKIASYNEVDGLNQQTNIESILAGGNPVVVALPIYPEFDNASATNPLVGLPQPGETSRGSHVVFATKYDANGLWIENQWGTGWGLNGWAELSWAFVNQYVNAVATESPLMPGGIVPNVIDQLPASAGNSLRAAGFGDVLTTAVDYTCNYIGRIKSESPTGWAVNGTTIRLVQGTRPPTPCP